MTQFFPEIVMAGNEQKTSDGQDSRDLYDAVLSFCAGDRKSVEVLALELARRGIRLYRDETSEAQAWGARLGAAIPPTTGVRSRYVIICLPRETARGIWEEAEETVEPGGVSSGSEPSASISYLCCPPESVTSIADRVSQELRKAPESVPRIWRVPLGIGTVPGAGVPVFEDKPPQD